MKNKFAFMLLSIVCPTVVLAGSPSAVYTNSSSVTTPDGVEIPYTATLSVTASKGQITNQSLTVDGTGTKRSSIDDSATSNGTTINRNFAVFGDAGGFRLGSSTGIQKTSITSAKTAITTSQAKGKNYIIDTVEASKQYKTMKADQAVALDMTAEYGGTYTIPFSGTGSVTGLDGVTRTYSYVLTVTASKNPTTGVNAITGQSLEISGTGSNNSNAGGSFSTSLDSKTGMITHKSDIVSQDGAKVSATTKVTTDTAAAVKAEAGSQTLIPAVKASNQYAVYNEVRANAVAQNKATLTSAQSTQRSGYARGFQSRGGRAGRNARG